MVRIYRRERDHDLMGIVEWPARDKKMSFRSFEELQADTGALTSVGAAVAAGDSPYSITTTGSYQ